MTSDTLGREARGESEFATELLELVVHGGGWPAVLGLVSKRAGRATRLVGTHGGVFASSDGQGRRTFGSRAPRVGVVADDNTEGGLEQATVAQILDSGTMPTVRCTDGFRALALPVHAGQRRIGLLLMEAPVSEAQAALLRAACLPVAVEAAQRDALARERARRGAAFVASLRYGVEHDAGLGRVAAHWNLDLTEPFAGVVLECRRPNSPWRTAASWIEHPVLIDGDRCLTLFNADVADQMQRVRRRLEGIIGGAVVGGAGPLVRGARAAARSLEQAERVLSHVVRCGTSQLTYDELGVTALLLSSPAEARADLVERQLGRLTERPDLMDTVQVWIESGCRRDDAAALLGLHRNSVGHRLARAAELLPAGALEPGLSPEVAAAMLVREIDEPRTAHH